MMGFSDIRRIQIFPYLSQLSLTFFHLWEQQYACAGMGCVCVCVCVCWERGMGCESNMVLYDNKSSLFVSSFGSKETCVIGADRVGLRNNLFILFSFLHTLYSGKWQSILMLSLSLGVKLNLICLNVFLQTSTVTKKCWLLCNDLFQCVNSVKKSLLYKCLTDLRSILLTAAWRRYSTSPLQGLPPFTLSLSQNLLLKYSQTCMTMCSFYSSLD